VLSALSVIPGGVGAILATLLQHYGKPEGVGDVTCYAVGPAAVFTAELAETVTPFVTSVVLGCVSSCPRSPDSPFAMSVALGCISSCTHSHRYHGMVKP
jgi:hypothetical protein